MKAVIPRTPTERPKAKLVMFTRIHDRGGDFSCTPTLRENEDGLYIQDPHEPSVRVRLLPAHLSFVRAMMDVYEAKQRELDESEARRLA